MTFPNRLADALQDRYTIERELGRGGMATVYLARDLKHGRSVAIKVMDPQLAFSLGADRFLLEIRTAAQLNHPHILPVFDSGEADGLLYYVMPHVEGESLRDRMDREGQTPIEDAVRIACQVADALAYAHARGIIHRDIKPENILFANPNHAYVSDFGLAKALFSAASTKLTRTGIAVGSPYYMSPEQAAGEEADARSDLYSLACVLYEMLAGKAPFQGATFHALSAARLEPPAPIPLPTQPKRSVALNNALQIALSPTPSERFPSANVFRHAITAELVHHDSHAKVSRGLLVSRHARSGGALLLTVATVVAVLPRIRSTPTELPVSVAVFPFDGLARQVRSNVQPNLHASLVSALDLVPNIRSVDGSTLLDQTKLPAPLAVTSLMELTRRAGAKYLITGTVLIDVQADRLTIDLYNVTTRDRVLHRQLNLQPTTIKAIDQVALQIVDQIAAREGLGLELYEHIRPTTTSLVALTELMYGQRLFHLGRTDEAVHAFQRAIQADSACALAYYRLSVAETWTPRWDYPAALRAIQAGLTNAQSAPPRYRELLVAQRHFVQRSADSAAFQFQKIVAENPAFPDALLGLAEVLFHYGAFLGEDPKVALPVLKKYLAEDTTFAPMEGHIVDLAIIADDEDMAREYLPRTDSARQIIRSAAVDLRFGKPQIRDSVLTHLRSSNRSTLSALISIFTYDGIDLALADTLAALLHSADRPFADRLRGAQLRLAILTAQGRFTDGIRIWRSIAKSTEFDPWVVHAYLAGQPLHVLAEPMFEWADRQLRSGTAPDFRPLVGGETMRLRAQDAFRALVHRATLHGDSSQVTMLLDRLSATSYASDPADPEPVSMRFALRARLALLARDTAAAITHLQQSVSRVPWSASYFMPLTDAAPQRLLLANLLAFTGDLQAAERHMSSFGRTWALGDVIFLPAVAEMRALHYPVATTAGNTPPVHHRRVVPTQGGKDVS